MLHVVLVHDIVDGTTTHTTRSHRFHYPPRTEVSTTLLAGYIFTAPRSRLIAFWGAPVVAGHPREFAEVFGERNQLSVSPARNSPPWMHTSRVHARMHSCALIHPTVALLAQCVHMPQSPRTLRGKTCTYAVPPSADLLRRRRRARWACFLGQHRPRAMHLGVDAMAGS